MTGKSTEGKSRFISPWSHIKNVSKEELGCKGKINEYSKRRPSTAVSSSNHEKPKMTVTDLMSKTVASVKSKSFLDANSMSYLDFQPSLISSDLQERSVSNENGSMKIGAILKSRYSLENDSLMGNSMESARQESARQQFGKTPREMVNQNFRLYRVEINNLPQLFVLARYDFCSSE